MISNMEILKQVSVSQNFMDIQDVSILDAAIFQMFS